MSITIPALSGDGGSVLAQSSDALDRYTGRSPGERGETDILKGKARRIADRLFGRRVDSGGPEQRALGKIFDTPPEDSINELSQKIGRASCRERVCQYVYISLVAVSLKKKQITKTGKRQN